MVFDAPLIYEWGNEGNFDWVVVVDAEEERCVSPSAAAQRLAGVRD